VQFRYSDKLSYIWVKTLVSEVLYVLRFIKLVPKLSKVLLRYIESCGFEIFWPTLLYMGQNFGFVRILCSSSCQISKLCEVCWDILKIVILRYFNHPSYIWVIFLFRANSVLRLVKLLCWVKFCWDMLKIVYLQYFDQPSYIWVRFFVSDVLYVLHIFKLLSFAQFCWDMLKTVDLRYFNQPS